MGENTTGPLWFCKPFRFPRLGKATSLNSRVLHWGLGSFASEIKNSLYCSNIKLRPLGQGFLTFVCVTDSFGDLVKPRDAFSDYFPTFYYEKFSNIQKKFYAKHLACSLTSSYASFIIFFQLSIHQLVFIFYSILHFSLKKKKTWSTLQICVYPCAWVMLISVSSNFSKCAPEAAQLCF